MLKHPRHSRRKLIDHVDAFDSAGKNRQRRHESQRHGQAVAMSHVAQIEEGIARERAKQNRMDQKQREAAGPQKAREL
jgi:hypothetical protein